MAEKFQNFKSFKTNLEIQEAEQIKQNKAK